MKADLTGITIELLRLENNFIPKSIEVDLVLTLERLANVSMGNVSLVYYDGMSGETNSGNRRLTYHGSLRGFYHPDTPCIENVVQAALLHEEFRYEEEGAKSLLIPAILRKSDIEAIGGYDNFYTQVRRAFEFVFNASNKNNMRKRAAKTIYILVDEQGFEALKMLQTQPAELVG